LNRAFVSVAVTEASGTDNVKGRGVPAGTVCGISSRGFPEESGYFFSRQLFKTAPRVLKTALTASFSTVMSRSALSATSAAAPGVVADSGVTGGVV
jgi:hypothetical protein